MLIFDLDGVVVDFCKAVYAVHNRKYEGNEPTKFDFFEDWGLTADQFWAPVDAIGTTFWENLPLFPWSQELLKLRASYPGEFRVATAASVCPYSAAGKVAAMRTIFGQRFRDYHITPRKWDLAAPGRLLIDDSDDNCEKFIAGGGEVILFPQPWNKNRHLIDWRMSYVKDNLAAFIKEQYAAV